MDTAQYLKRINYQGEIEPTLETLTSLQRHHLLTVPFENLDIHNNTPIQLDEEKIYWKIVDRKRGGFCYELNGLFLKLLEALGFEVKRISARTFEIGAGFGREFDHMAIIAKIEDSEYLVDVGFGEFAFSPLEMVLNEELKDERGIFKLEQHDEQYVGVSHLSENEWVADYIFTKKERAFSEYMPMCIYHQTSPDSHFTTKKMCSLALENGRVTLTGNELKFTENGTIRTENVKTKSAFRKHLANIFKIEM